MIKRRSRSVVWLMCFGAIAILLPSWAFRTKQAIQLNNLTENEVKDVVISLQRTGCYGSCAAYKLTIYGDGRLEYEGENNVKVKGKKEGHIDLADIKRIVSEFDKANYFSLDQYTENHCASCTLCTDMPTTFTEIRVKGTSHKVEHYYGCSCAPKPLWDLEGTVDRIARTEQWTGDVSKQGPFGTTCFRK
jgi:hypothetical protein